jgi:aspartyl/glutamyl-tRNA(Asn/Gln) amidotransferase C subunit
MRKQVITKDLIKVVENLSRLSVDKKEEAYFVDQFNETLNVIGVLDKLDTKNVESTSQVTGLTNVFREDSIDKDKMLSQKEALSNAKNVHNGFFVVKAIFND